MMSMAKSFRSTDSFLDAYAKVDPGAKDVKELINQYNGNAEAAFYAKAKEMGADVNAILSMIPR